VALFNNCVNVNIFFQRKYTTPIPEMDFEVRGRGQYSICGTRWCPRMFGTQEITLVLHPNPSSEYFTLKVTLPVLDNDI